MYRINITEAAHADLQNAALYIAVTLNNKTAANRLLDLTNEKISVLSHAPYINALVKDTFLASSGIRMQIVNNYLAFYVIREEIQSVSVIRFLYSRRDWISILKNDFQN